MSEQASCSKRVDGTVVLLSGGVDSTVLLYLMHAQSGGNPVFPLFVDYAQRAARHEQQACEWHCQRLGFALRTLNLSQVGESFRQLESLKRHVPLPSRNLVVLSLALSYVEVVHASRLAIGITQDDLDGYPSASLKFLEAFRDLAATLGPVRVDAPFVDRSKSAVASEGQRLGVDFARTYSCMLGGPEHCGRCGQCRNRSIALRQLV